MKAATPARVLVVDDSATIRRVVGSVLARAGYDVSTAESGERAVADIAGFQPELLLLDSRLPGLSGLPMLKALSETPGAESLPIVLMCARGEPLARSDANLRTVGVVDVITKPFSPEALLAVVHHSLEKHGRRPVRDTTRVVAALASLAATDDISGEAPFVSAGDDADERTDTQRDLRRRQASATATQVNGVAPPMSRGQIALPAGFALCGDLTVIGLPEVLQLLKFQALSGRLHVDAAGLHFEMGLDAGAIVSLSATTHTGEPARRGDFLLGRYAVAGGFVDETTLAQTLATPDPAPIGERLVRAGHIDDNELRRLLGEQTQDLMVELLRARRGVFALAAGLENLPAAVVRPGWNIDVLMFEALRQVDEWAVIEAEVPSFEARFAQRAAQGGVVDDSGLSAEEGAMLRALKSGPLSVRDLVKRSPLRAFDACRVLYRLAVLKRVRRIDEGDRSRLVSDESAGVPLLSTPPVEAP